MGITRFYKLVAHPKVIKWNCDKFANQVKTVTEEVCFYVETDPELPALTTDEENTLIWLFKDPQCDAVTVTKCTKLHVSNKNAECIIEIGPRLNFSTPSSTNSVSILHNVGISKVVRVEKTRRYYFQFCEDAATIDKKFIESHLCDRMTECCYTEANIPVNSFNEALPRRAEKDWKRVPILTGGRKALEELNAEMGLAFDDWDLEYYTELFRNKLKRDPTTVEIFDCAQSNSEHSRHWFFKGRITLDGQRMDDSLIDLIIATQQHSNANNTIKFSDNSSAIKGYQLAMLQPKDVTKPSNMERTIIDMDLIFTAETHNMPTAVEPFSGATTGTGGRIRDVQAVGRGGLTIAGTAGYCVGFLNIPGYSLSYERPGLPYPISFADPLKVLIRASDGASDYGNKFGEPVISGFVTSYGWTGANNQREEFVKPIMFSGGIGLMPATMRDKLTPQKGYLLAKLGGPVYRIGVGGGAASSVVVQGTNEAALDFNAVQRGDAEMENKLNRVIRACVELGTRNPIAAIHDQGAGGNGNVLKELVEKTGAKIFTKEFKLGDPTISTLELWGAEYQETNAIVCRSEDRQLLEQICARERCPVSFVGVVGDDGFVTLIEGGMNDEGSRGDHTEHPFHMHLDDILGKMPQKEYNLTMKEKPLQRLILPQPFDWPYQLEKLLSVLSVGSKRFLTNKVDRSVTGLIAQQQCVGPLQVPLADYAICAGGYFGFQGVATSIGTQPLKGTINPIAGARMSVAEAISNLVFVKISSLQDVKCSGNWMWPAKLPGEGAKLYIACQEMCKLMGELGIAIDGGKDSLSMATRVNAEDVVKSPDTLVVSAYVPCPDITLKVTPDLKMPHRDCVGDLIWVNIEDKFRLGGSALAQSLGQQGDDCPNLLRADLLKLAFNLTQDLIHRNLLLAGHDISEGGLLACVLEMAFGGACGLDLNVPDVDAGPVQVLFSEEVGWVVEVDPRNMIEVLSEFKSHSVPVYHIGQSVGRGTKSTVSIRYNDELIMASTTLELMQQWERTSFEIEKIQMDSACAIEEYESLKYRTGPQYHCTFDPDVIHPVMKSNQIPVAVVREEGVNGDREMMATLMMANFAVHDVTMSDLVHGRTTLDNYRGVVFPGGFSYADTLGSGKGWAASIKFNKSLQQQFAHFRDRKDTFSIGVCNGCQLMGFLGWIGTNNEANDNIPDVALIDNRSGRYESRWSSIRIEKNTNSIFLKRMSGSVLGCWIAHGEGRFAFKDNDTFEAMKRGNAIAMTYVDDDNQPTEIYPMNPNGSKGGIAAISSADGRHLALMPHPERCSIMWQWPYVPHEFQYRKSPWQTLFDEAQIWCYQNQ